MLAVGNKANAAKASWWLFLSSLRISGGMGRLYTRKPTLIALLALCLCLPLAGAEKKKPLPKDLESAKALAEKGDARAQYNLGSMYEEGKGVPKDVVTAYAWYNIAAANGDEYAKKTKDDLAKRITLDQISKAQERVKQMVKKNPQLLEAEKKEDK